MRELSRLLPRDAGRRAQDAGRSARLPGAPVLQTREPTPFAPRLGTLRVPGLAREEGEGPCSSGPHSASGDGKGRSTGIRGWIGGPERRAVATPTPSVPPCPTFADTTLPLPLPDPPTPSPCERYGNSQTGDLDGCPCLLCWKSLNGSRKLFRCGPILGDWMLPHQNISKLGPWPCTFDP